ncbi:hypothetical protein OUZ56_005793 [Daphnia magna]|uniref:Uncharacterized protein n=1 Tax=Daphnia magna TaxID=35525 RepID=A0ABQ9YTT0_9CRUS|nr:hypothetical protein OUZ56_005793 [Daphnia magna]
MEGLNRCVADSSCIVPHANSTIITASSFVESTEVFDQRTTTVRVHYHWKSVVISTVLVKLLVQNHGFIHVVRPRVIAVIFFFQLDKDFIVEFVLASCNILAQVIKELHFSGENSNHMWDIANTSSSLNDAIFCISKYPTTQRISNNSLEKSYLELPEENLVVTPAFSVHIPACHFHSIDVGIGYVNLNHISIRFTFFFNLGLCRVAFRQSYEEAVAYHAQQSRILYNFYIFRPRLADFVSFIDVISYRIHCDENATSVGFDILARRDCQWVIERSNIVDNLSEFRYEPFYVHQWQPPCSSTFVTSKTFHSRISGSDSIVRFLFFASSFLFVLQNDRVTLPTLSTSNVSIRNTERNTFVCEWLNIIAFAKPEKPLPSAFDLARQLITESPDQQNPSVVVETGYFRNPIFQLLHLQLHAFNGSALKTEPSSKRFRQLDVTASRKGVVFICSSVVTDVVRVISSWIVQGRLASHIQAEGLVMSLVEEVTLNSVDLFGLR